MDIVLHMPRDSEAITKIDKSEGMRVTPKFYAKQGVAPVVFLTVSDAKGNDIHKYVIKINGKDGIMRMYILREVEPEIDKLE